ncbi:MAG: CcdB family protein [Deltaproteobacteria bacterium]|nr:CcdB family protein [Deltaproteobacteria bacterium]
MHFLDVCRNADRDGAAAVPYLLVVQADLLAGLGTRVVVPLYRAELVPGPRLAGLMPVFEVEGIEVVAVVPELVGLETRLLGEEVTRLDAHRDEILAALDLLLTGV